jgi:GDP-L-fucose synthase
MGPSLNISTVMRLDRNLSKDLNLKHLKVDPNPMGIIVAPSSNFWKDKMVLVPGGAGFIGSHLVENLVKLHARVRVVDNLENGSRSNLPAQIELVANDLFNMGTCEAVCEDIDIIINLAAKVAGVGYNVQHPGEMFYKNAQLNLNMLEAARLHDVDRYVVVSSACVYERTPPIPTPESHGFVGDPEPTNLGYGWAKRVAEVQARVYADEYGMKISIVRPYNTYGPRDHFETDKAHVIPTLIRKVYSEANELVVWGDGSQKRSFVFVSDLVQGLLLAAERYPIADPINIGNDEEVSIADLVQIILKASGKELTIMFDPSKPSGQLRRCPDLQRAKDFLGYSPRVSTLDGVRRTVEWYRDNIQQSKLKPLPAK